ncbi:MAG: hypothetical protein ACW98Y_16930, partial [Candidatus Thorarchaeota archaeon]
MQRRFLGVVIVLVLSCLTISQTNVSIESTTLDRQLTEHNTLADGESIPFETRWSSRDNVHGAELMDNDTIEADRIEVIATFPNSTDTPHDNIINVQWRASSGFIENRNSSLVVPEDEDYEPFIMGLELQNLAWERIDGIHIGDDVRLTLHHNNTDTDVLVYWADMDNSTWLTDGGITARQMATAGTYETG